MCRMSKGPAVAGITLEKDEREKLEELARRRKISQAMALRCRIVLECAKGKTNTQVARSLKVSMPTVGKWRERFGRLRLAGLADAPRPGPAPQDYRCHGRAGDHANTGEQAGERHPVEHPQHGAKKRPDTKCHPPHLEDLRIETALTADIQAVHRSLLCGKSAGCGWPLHPPAGADAGGGSLRR
jgi:hypothetical protein